jgi:hypothetical protein
MLISDQQQTANQENAQHSTGPKTDRGKAVSRLNALKYGLRARTLIITGEDPAEYEQLWTDLEADWQPQTRTERLFLEQMAYSQWLLARMVSGESRIYEADLPVERQFALLDRVAAQRVRLERSFAAAARELKQLKKERQAIKPQQPAQKPQPPETESESEPIQTPSGPQPPPPDYVMSGNAEDYPGLGSPFADDTR